jgi:hypothetical protein
MTTDLTGDFELGEDEFDWDVFLPDSDGSEVEDAAAALEDEGELSLDDSDFDWDGALRDDAGPENGADGGARAGAAYDRIVDTVRRTFEDEPSTQADTEPQADTSPALVAEDEAERLRDTEQEPIVSGFAASFAHPVEPEADADAVAWAPAATFEPDSEPAPVVDLEPESTWRAEPTPEPTAVFVQELGLDAESYAGPGADLEAGGEGEPELDHWLAPDDEAPLAGAELEPVAFEPAHEIEPAAPHFAEAAATAGVVGAPEPAQPPFSDETTWATWEAGPPPEFVPDPVHGGSGEAGQEKPKRSRVFKATVALACLFLVAAGAVLALRALHHPTTTAAPPAHVTTPTQAATRPGSTGTAAAGTGRMQAATDAIDSATTAASVGLTSLAAFPTPTNVETVINPYISSLQLYQTFLSGTKVPASSQPAAAAAAAKVRQDLQFLETIDGLPPQELGAFLVQFDTDATQLQTTLSTLEQDLRTPAS